MRRIPLLAVLSLCACTSAAPVYAPGDPLGEKTKPTTFPRPGAPDAPLFRAVMPEGYRPSDGELGAPVLAMLTRGLNDRESAVIVERYAEADGNAVALASFWSNVSAEGKPVSRVFHKIGQRAFEAAHGLEFSRFTRRISAGDPYLDYLGSKFPPPRLSFAERRRFLAGGDAYRLYRCRKLSAWGILSDYRRARAGKRLQEFREKNLGASDRKILAACFGTAVLMAMGREEEIPDVPKPGMHSLRMMAREEREHGATVSREVECVHAAEIPGGIIVIRLRSPRDDFEAEHRRFEAFLGSFVYL